MRFEHPWFLLLLIPLFILFFLRRERKYFGFSSISNISKIKGFNSWIKSLSQAFLLLAIFFSVIALALPQGGLEEEEVTFHGREMILSIDTSFSMGGQALETVKRIVKDFIRKRRNDLIGITIYGTDAALIVLPTWELSLLDKSIDRIHSSQVGAHSAVGEGLFTSLTALIEKEMGNEFEFKKLRRSVNSEYLKDYAVSFAKRMGKKGSLKNKVIILFSDGIYNTGINPARVLRIIERLGIKVYAIVVKPSGETGVEPELAEERIAELKKGVESTGGTYFEAENYLEVEQFYEIVDELEKDKIVIEKINKRKSLLIYPAIIGLFFMIGKITLSNIWLKIP